MKKGIHPTYGEVEVTCSCGNVFTIKSVLAEKGGKIHADVCSQCHPFYTGKQKIIDTAGTVDDYKRRYGSFLKGSKKKSDDSKAAEE